MKSWKKVQPQYPTGKKGSFVAGNRIDNPIKIDFFSSPEETQSLYAKIYFQKECEGPPQHVHGGCQAAVLDEIMGSCGWVNGFKILAAKIEVEFLRMLPSEKEVYGQANIYKTEDRKIYIEAKLYIGETIYSKSKGLFMSLSDKKVKELESFI